MIIYNNSIKTLFVVVLLLTQLNSSAQFKTKKVLVEGRGTPLVLLAGALAPMAALSSISTDLSVNYKVIRMEHLNIQYAAEGWLLPKDYSIRSESEAIKYTLDSLGIKEPVVLVGSSYGGLIAIDFALRFPKQTHSLIALEPPAFTLLKSESIEGLQKTLNVTKTLTPEAEITEDHVEAFRCLSLNCDSISVRQHPQWKGWMQQKNRLRGLSVAGEYKVELKNIRKFKKPVLLVTGTETNAIHKRIDELLVKAFPNAKEIYLKSGHSIPSTVPKELVKAIIEFLN